MSLPRLGTALLLTGICVGCANFGAVTEIRPDGTWTREVRFSSTQEFQGDPERFLFSIRSDLEEYFDLTVLKDWKERAANELGTAVFIATREAKAGEKLTDLALKSKAGEVAVRNIVTVRKLSEKRFEYVETIRFVGETPTQLEEPTPAQIEYFASRLPEDLEEKDRVAREMARAALRAYVSVLYGGTGQEPLMSEALVHRHIALRRIEVLLRRDITAELKERLKDHPQAERLPQIVADVVRATSISDIKQQDTDSGDLLDDDRSLVPLDFVLRFPGKIVETNGKLDPLTGEVYWTLFAASPILGDVVLRAVCEID